MIDTSNFTLFVVTSIAVILMPGPAMLFVISNGLTRGPKASIAAAFGTTTGVSFHLFCAAFGLAVILKTSVIAFTVVKIDMLYGFEKSLCLIISWPLCSPFAALMNHKEYVRIINATTSVNNWKFRWNRFSND